MTDSPAWPQSLPFFRLMGLVLSLSALFWFVKLWQKHAPFVERHDLGAYVHASLPPVPFWKAYRLLVRKDGIDAIPSDEGSFHFETGEWNHDLLRAWLRQNVYGGEPLWLVLKWPLAGFGCVLIGLLILGTRLDRRINREAREGVVISGVRRVSLRVWNQAVSRRDRGPAIRLTWGRNLRLSKQLLSQHVVIEGGTGSGKSVIARQIAQYLLTQGPVIFLDPKREFVQEFAGPDDWILDPGDERCPRWELESESLDEMRATAPATAAFPDLPYANPFFRTHPRFIIAHILGNHRPTTKELAAMLAGPNEIARLLRGTELSHSVAGLGEMQSSMLAALAELGRSLRFWPNEPERRGFSISRWGKERKGNIFFTSSPDTLDALKPSQSMQLDMLILAMQKHRLPGALMLEEIAHAMDRLPKLESAISLQRDAGNPIVLIFQEVSQLKGKYGELWTALVSQAFTHFVLRTREKQSAVHSSGLLGEQEVERVRESRSGGWLQLSRITYSSERITKPVVATGEIQSLKPLRGYAAQEDRIVKFRLKYRSLIPRAPRLIERIIKPPEPTPEPPPAQQRYVRRSKGTQKATA